MSRYFIEVAYLGTAYAGFQRQDNAHTVQAELEKVLGLLNRQPVQLTGSSRTDAGVHALQNFFHYDTELEQPEKLLYNINALLPRDCVARSLRRVAPDAHCRFDAVSREYRYHCTTRKDPFLEGRAYYFPYTANLELMQAAAAILLEYRDFTSFSKRNTQVKTFICQLTESRWEAVPDGFTYYVKGNRFLRGMVRALTGTMLRVGRGKMDLDMFRRVIEAKDCTLADFSVPAHGLFLEKVNYPENKQAD